MVAYSWADGPSAAREIWRVVYGCGGDGGGGGGGVVKCRRAMVMVPAGGGGDA